MDQKKKMLARLSLPLRFRSVGQSPPTLTNVPVVHGSYVRSQPAVGLRDGPHHLLVQLVQLHGEVGEAVHLQTDERHTHTHTLTLLQRGYTPLKAPAVTPVQSWGVWV